MACMMIPSLAIFDTIPKLHTALMPPLSVPCSNLSPPSLNYLPNAAIGHPSHIPVFSPDVISSLTPILNLSGYEQMFDVDSKPILFSAKSKENHSSESSKSLPTIPFSSLTAKNLIERRLLYQKQHPVTLCLLLTPVHHL